MPGRARNHSRVGAAAYRGEMGQSEATPTPLWSDNPSERDLLGFSDIAAPARARGARSGEARPRHGRHRRLVGLRQVDDPQADRARAAREGEGVVVVDTSPWEYDPATDPKATLIAEVLAALQARASEGKALSTDVKERFAKLFAARATCLMTTGCWSQSTRRYMASRSASSRRPAQRRRLAPLR